MTGYIDKNGKEIPLNSIVYGHLYGESEMHYFGVTKTTAGTIQLLACTYGYVHNVQQGHMDNMELIGPKEENLHLLECD